MWRYFHLSLYKTSNFKGILNPQNDKLYIELVMLGYLEFLTGGGLFFLHASTENGGN